MHHTNLHHLHDSWSSWSQSKCLCHWSSHLSVGGIHTFPLATATWAQEIVRVSANAFVKGVVIFIQVFQVGDALAGSCLPRGHAPQHQKGVKPQESDDDEPADDQDEEVNEEQDVGLEPVSPQSLEGNAMPGWRRKKKKTVVVVTGF